MTPQEFPQPAQTVPLFNQGTSGHFPATGGATQAPIVPQHVRNAVNNGAHNQLNHQAYSAFVNGQMNGQNPANFF
jgi:hypothetical protein